MSSRRSARSPESPRKRTTWLGFAELHPTSRGTHRLKPRWARIASAFALLMIVGYLSAGFGVYLLYKERRNFTELAYTDVLLLRRDAIRQKQGEHDIEEGLRALRAGEIRVGYNYLRSGIRRAPDHLEGRLTLIALIAQSQPETALQLLDEGLNHGGRDDFDFVRTYAEYLLRQREDAALLTMVKNELPAAAGKERIPHALRLYGFRALMNLGDYATAARWFEEEGLNRSLDGVIFASYGLAQAEQLPRATAILNAIHESRPGEPIPVLVETLIQYHLELGNHRVATGLALDYALADPMAWRPRRLLLECHHAAGREDEIAREGPALIRQFRDNPEAITAFAQFAEKTGRTDLARLTYEVALENAFHIARFGLLFIETHLSAGLYAQTNDLCAEIERENPAWLANFRSEFSGLRAVAAFAMGDPQIGEIHRNQFLQAAQRRPDVFRAVAKAFQKAQLPAHAYQLLEEAHLLDPKNELVLADLLALQIELGESAELTRRVDTLTQLRRPSYEIFNKIQSELGSDRFIFAENRGALSEKVEQVLGEISPPALDGFRLAPATPTDAPTSES